MEDVKTYGVAQINIIDMEDSEYDETFLVDEAKYLEIKDALTELEREYLNYQESGEVPEIKYVKQSLIASYINENISWYNFLYEVFTDISIPHNTYKYNA